jgi:hypothetical protein
MITSGGSHCSWSGPYLVLLPSPGCKPTGRRFSQLLSASPNEWRKRPRRLTTKSFRTGVSTQTESYRDAR